MVRKNYKIFFAKYPRKKLIIPENPEENPVKIGFVKYISRRSDLYGQTFWELTIDAEIQRFSPIMKVFEKKPVFRPPLL